MLVAAIFHNDSDGLTVQCRARKTTAKTYKGCVVGNGTFWKITLNSPVTVVSLRGSKQGALVRSSEQSIPFPACSIPDVVNGLPQSIQLNNSTTQLCVFRNAQVRSAQLVTH